MNRKVDKKTDGSVVIVGERVTYDCTEMRKKTQYLVLFANGMELYRDADDLAEDDGMLMPSFPEPDPEV